MEVRLVAEVAAEVVKVVVEEVVEVVVEVLKVTAQAVQMYYPRPTDPPFSIASPRALRTRIPPTKTISLQLPQFI